MDLTKLFSLLRARKVFRLTRVLYPTNGVPPFTVGSVWDFEDLEKRLGVAVKTITYREMAEDMNRLLGDRTAGQKAEQDAAELIRKADKSFIEKDFVLRSLLFETLHPKPDGAPRVQRVHHRLLRVLPQHAAAALAGHALPAARRVRQRGDRLVVRGRFRVFAGGSAVDERVEQVASPRQRRPAAVTIRSASTTVLRA